MGIDWLALAPEPRRAAEVARLVRESPLLSGPLPGSLRTDESQKIRWGSAPNGNGTWIVTDYEVARRVLVDPRVSRAAAVQPGAPRLGLGEPARASIISLDGGEHARLRRLISGAFTERRVAGLSPFIDDLVAGLLDDMQTRTVPVDVVASLTGPLPLRVLCAVLGIPWQDHEMFGPAITVLFETQGDTADNRIRSLRLVRYMTALIAQKRSSGGDECGDPVVVSVLGANHSTGNAFPPGAARYLTFGHGVHRCVGAPLARIQLASALQGLLTRFPGLELADDPAALSWKTGSTSRGLTRLNVTWPSEQKP
jgi:cytochrome P450